jgi:hypothetical protein
MGFALLVRPLVELCVPRRRQNQEQDRRRDPRASQPARNPDGHYFGAIVTMPAVLSIVTLN